MLKLYKNKHIHFY